MYFITLTILVIINCYSLIDNKLSNNQSVLIHCRAGMQRSAALLALYLMKKNKYSFDKAKSIIKKERWNNLVVREMCIEDYAIEIKLIYDKESGSRKFLSIVRKEKKSKKRRNCKMKIQNENTK